MKKKPKKKDNRTASNRKVNRSKVAKKTIVISNKVSESLPIYKIDSGVSKIVDESWDFRKAKTKEYTHCFHSYPAMMIPQVARRIIDRYAKKSTLLFDPYCGTGTSLVEANIQGIDAIGTDINPLANLIAKTKTTKIDIQVLDLFLHDFMSYFFSINFQVDSFKNVVVPNIKNIDFWFSKSVQNKLAILKAYINNIKDDAIRNFFFVAFSETVRESSYQKLREFKLVRRKDFAQSQEPDVFGLMIMKLSRNKHGLVEFIKACKKNIYTKVYNFNTVNTIPINYLPNGYVDIVVTSPPYGDSRTTVAYGQYSRLSNEWLGINNANQIDNHLMGGRKLSKNTHFNSDILNDVVAKIKKNDAERVKDVISFYHDYENSIKNVGMILKKGGFACYVVGNRTVKGVEIPTDEITASMFAQNNFTHIETIVRNIPNKRMPLKNSPSNVAGETASTMKNEYIVVCRKN